MVDVYILMRFLSLLQKSINDSVYKGYMEMSSDLGKTWHRRWLEVHSDHSLCCYKAPQVINKRRCIISDYKTTVFPSSGIDTLYIYIYIYILMGFFLSLFQLLKDIRPLIVLHLSCCTIEVCVTINYSAKIIRVQSEEKVYLLKPDDKKELPR